ncbi:hypothetical protein QAD02_015833 [Eretmocerus hayati]|uniref:Uncharacterized protein n=1 Tax=Eretmocerus hayati TaxID=131215 RepID=A0ACC2P9B9_9HYME|nr:hypothetical protein QAD02_015833 [Eretmocerus hayati]
MGETRYAFIQDVTVLRRMRRGLFEPSLWASFLLKGHGSLNLTLYSRNLSDSPECFCGDPTEDVAHVLCECRLYRDIRDLDAMGVLRGGNGSWDFSQVFMKKPQYLALSSFAEQA